MIRINKDYSLVDRRSQKILRTGDLASRFNTQTPEEILVDLGKPASLLSASAKSKKCESVGVLARSLFMTSGIFCPSASRGCLKVCLGHSSGRMGHPKSTEARDRRAALYIYDTQEFLSVLTNELNKLRQKAEKSGMTPSVRLNATSDIAWEEYHSLVFTEFPEIQFFDYTKIRRRMWNFIDGHTTHEMWPSNYHLTLSVSERNQQDARRILDAGFNVAIVFWPKLPSSWWGFPVIDGDQHDARFLDPTPSIVGLSAKGVAKKDLSGFVIKV